MSDTETSAQYVHDVVDAAAEALGGAFGGAVQNTHTIEVHDEKDRNVLLIAVPVPEPTVNSTGQLTVGELIALLATTADFDAPVLMSGRDAGWYEHVDSLALPDVDEGFVLPTLMGGADFDTRSV